MSLAEEVSGREFLQGIIDGRFPPPPMAVLMGMRLVSVGDGEASSSASRTRGSTTRSGWSTAAGSARCSTRPPAAPSTRRCSRASGYSSIEIKVSFLKAVSADAGVVEVTGRVLRAGRRVAFAEAAARNGSGGLVGHATASLAILARPAP